MDESLEKFTHVNLFVDLRYLHGNLCLSEILLSVHFSVVDKNTVQCQNTRGDKSECPLTIFLKI
jgi:hypothetical protein